MMINYVNGKNINKEQLEKLYADAEWYAYTQDLDVLRNAINQSLEVISAWLCP